MRTLSPIKVQDYIETLAEHAIDSGLSGDEIADQLRKRYLEIALDLEGGNQCATAKRLGLHRNTIARRIDTLGIGKKGYTLKHGKRGEIL